MPPLPCLDLVGLLKDGRLARAETWAPPTRYAVNTV